MKKKKKFILSTEAALSFSVKLFKLFNKED